MIWAKEETLPRDEIEKIQLEKLKKRCLTYMRELLLIVRKWNVQE